MTESMHNSMRVKRQLTAKTLTDIGMSLTDIDWRLLHWLLRYPLQRADDLMVGVARWASRATVFRHVRLLEASGLYEGVLPKTPGTGKRLYHLSNPGLHLLAMHLGTPARALARRWQADEAGLMRLLPRLPTLLVLQDVINGLITHVADAMTTQGRRPELVRWTWQRNMTHRFLYREKRMRFFADGVAALCIRTRLSESGVLDQWYGVLFLSTELDDERLMHLRLERLMCWRESPQRWSWYQHMLPVLILATSPRQAEHWQHAIATSALKLRLDPLSGALACVSQQDCAYVNPWRFAWRSLSTNQSCHLADSLRAVPREVFSSFLDVVEGEEEMQHAGALPNASGASGSSGRLTHLVVGNLVHRAATIASSDLEEREVIALLGLRLTPGHWSIMRLLLAHPLLSDEELAGLLDMERKSVRSSLYMLHTLGCLEPISTSVGKRWHFCERGLLLVAAANHLHLRNFAVASKAEAEEEAPHIELRGEAWLLQHIQHTAGVYGFFASLAQAAKQQPGQKLCWWETSAICERRYQIREQWYNLRPDALAAYRVGSKQIHFWLEWDRGTMNTRDLETKFISYAHYIDSREWAREWATLPLLVCIAPDIAQERRIQRVTQTKLARIPGLKVCTTTEGMLKEYGPLAPIWITGIISSSYAVSRSSPSRKLVFQDTSSYDA